MTPARPAPLIVRRALGAPRDLRAVLDLLRAAGEPVGDSPSRWLSADVDGLALLAERRGDPLGLAVVRWLRPVGASAADAPSLAVLATLYAVDDDARDALVEAAKAEAEARGVEVLHRLRSLVEGDVAAPDVVASAVREPVVDDDAGEDLSLGDGVVVRLRTRATPRPAATLWSGAVDFRTRWQSDRAGMSWNVDGLLGSRDDEGSDALRFDPITRELRESSLRRPKRRRVDAELLARVASLPVTAGALHLVSGDGFTLAPMDVSLYDTDLGCFVALREGYADRASTEGLSPRAVPLSEHAALLIDEGAVVGWRVLDPLSHARAMGWPESRDPSAVSAARRATLAGVLYDWITIDGGAVVRPDEASDPEEIAHMVAVRDRARELADVHPGAADDAADVARDVAAHIHWSWGFFRVAE